MPFAHTRTKNDASDDPRISRYWRSWEESREALEVQSATRRTWCTKALKTWCLQAAALGGSKSLLCSCNVCTHTSIVISKQGVLVCGLSLVCGIFPALPRGRHASPGAEYARMHTYPRYTAGMAFDTGRLSFSMSCRHPLPTNGAPEAMMFTSSIATSSGRFAIWTIVSPTCLPSIIGSWT